MRRLWRLIYESNSGLEPKADGIFRSRGGAVGRALSQKTEIQDFGGRAQLEGTPLSSSWTGRGYGEDRRLRIKLHVDVLDGLAHEVP